VPPRGCQAHPLWEQGPPLAGATISLANASLIPCKCQPRQVHPIIDRQSDQKASTDSITF